MKIEPKPVATIRKEPVQFVISGRCKKERKRTQRGSKSRIEPKPGQLRPSQSQNLSGRSVVLHEIAGTNPTQEKIEDRMQSGCSPINAELATVEAFPFSRLREQVARSAG
jgi:hypothetical protein